MKNFFAGLSRSAKMTLIVCGSFIILTMLILIFLMLCPIQTDSAANHANDDLIVTTSISETTETTVSSTSTTKFNRKTTDANRTTTFSQTRTTYSYQENNVYDDYDDVYNDDEDVYQPVQTTYEYQYTQPSYTTAAPVWTSPVTQVPTNPTVVTDSTMQETFPSQDSGEEDIFYN